MVQRKKLLNGHVHLYIKTVDTEEFLYWYHILAAKKEPHERLFYQTTREQTKKAVILPGLAERTLL